MNEPETKATELLRGSKQAVIHEKPHTGTFLRQAAWVKPVIIFVMLLVLLIPLAFIRSLVGERERYQRTAETSIMEPVGGEPSIEGIVLAVPYEETVEYTDSSDKIVRKDTRLNYILTVPESYELATHIEPYHLSRGIFTVPIFNGDAGVKASFSEFEFKQFNIEEKDIRYKDAVLILGIKDKKTLTAYPVLRVNGPCNRHGRRRVFRAAGFLKRGR